MKPRFSPRELFVLRNDVPVNWLIARLGLPHKIKEGTFQFRCPCCKGFDTSANLTTNLARCFSCSRSFNTIDLVMATAGLDFIAAVEFLKRCLSGLQILADKEGSSQFPSRPLTAGAVLKSLGLAK